MRKKKCKIITREIEKKKDHTARNCVAFFALLISLRLPIEYVFTMKFMVVGIEPGLSIVYHKPLL